MTLRVPNGYLSSLVLAKNACLLVSKKEGKSEGRDGRNERREETTRADWRKERVELHLPARPAAPRSFESRGQSPWTVPLLMYLCCFTHGNAAVTVILRPGSEETL